jgi:hypothetical protein
MLKFNKFNRKKVYVRLFTVGAFGAFKCLMPFRGRQMLSARELKNLEHSADLEIHLDKFKPCLSDINNLNMDHKIHITTLFEDLGSSITGVVTSNVVKSISLPADLLGSTASAEMGVIAISEAANMYCNKIALVSSFRTDSLKNTVRKDELYDEFYSHGEEYCKLFRKGLESDVGGTAQKLGTFLDFGDLEAIVSLYRLAETGNELVVCLTSDYALLLVMGPKIFGSCYSTLHTDGNFIEVLRVCAVNLQYQKKELNDFLPSRKQLVFHSSVALFGFASLLNYNGYMAAASSTLVPKVLVPSILVPSTVLPLLENARMLSYVLTKWALSYSEGARIAIFEEILALAQNLKDISNVLKKK